MNGVFAAFQGRPFTVVTAAAGALNAPGNTQTADQVKPVVEKLGGIGAGQPFFDPTAFAAPTGVRFGTSGRNLLRGPGAVNLDLGLFRKFPHRERFNLEFRGGGRESFQHAALQQSERQHQRGELPGGDQRAARSAAGPRRSAVTVVISKLGPILGGGA